MEKENLFDSFITSLDARNYDDLPIMGFSFYSEKFELELEDITLELDECELRIEKENLSISIPTEELTRISFDVEKEPADDWDDEHYNCNFYAFSMNGLNIDIDWEEYL